jgi:hypothetical protein
MSKKVYAANHAPTGFVLFMAYCGAAVYFIQQSSGFFGVIWALIKAIVWPAIVVFQVFTSFGV